jgi:hypothetical protein
MSTIIHKLENCEKEFTKDDKILSLAVKRILYLLTKKRREYG